MISLEEIVSLEGIVIRRIPKVSTTTYLYQKGDERRSKSPKDFMLKNGRLYTHRHTVNTLGGKYLVTFKRNQYAQVRFDKGRDGVGDTIKEAYRNYLQKPC